MHAGIYGWLLTAPRIASHRNTMMAQAADLPSNSDAGTYELNNIIQKEGIKNLLYMGVHENMCIMARPFAIEKWIGA